MTKSRRTGTARSGAALGFALACSAGAVAGVAAEPGPPAVGGYSAASVTHAEVVAAARFAVRAQELAMRGKDPGARLDLVTIAAARQQVVAGMNYRLELRVKAGGAEKAAEAVVWWQAWNAREPYKLTSWTWK